MNDFRFALRQLRKSPGFTFIAVLTLALGIGANTAVFSVVNAVLLKRLPYPQPQELMIANEYNMHIGELHFDWPDFLDLRAQNHSFAEVAAFRQKHLTLTHAGEPVLTRAGEVSASFFSLLGARPILGRTFSKVEDRAGAPPTAVLSYALWQDRFHHDEGIVGKTLDLNDTLYTIVGVLPRGFSFFPRTTDLYLPIGLETNTAGWLDRADHVGLSVLARLRSGLSVTSAQSDLDALMRRIEADYPASNRDVRVQVQSLYNERFGDARPILLILFAAAGCIMLIACGNIANLQLARAMRRQREFAIRTALGASRSRLVRQLLVEGILLALIGGALGLLLAQWAMEPLLRIAPTNLELPRITETRIDGGALLFNFVLSVVTGIFFGLAPAFESFKINLSETLQESGRSATASPLHQPLRAALLISQVTLAVALLIISVLLIRSLIAVQAVDPGFKVDHILAIDLNLPASSYGTNGAQITFFERAVAQIRSLPGVSAAGAVFCPPLVDAWRSSPYLLAGKSQPPTGALPSCLFNVADPGYFHVVRPPLIEGRYLNETDNAHSPPVIVVNQNLAHRCWPNESALGQRIKVGDPESKEPYREIIGVVGDVKQDGLEAPPQPEVFLPLAQDPRPTMTLLARTSTEPLASAAAVVKRIHLIDPNLPVAKVQPMSAYLSETLARRRFSTLLLGIFSALALLLAFVGVYGVMAFSVAQRTREVGIRLALGAQQSDVLLLVVRQGMTLAIIGLLGGLLCAIALTHVVKSFLFGVSATDATTFGLISLLLLLVSFLACLLPARRAAKVDPIIALRTE